MHYTSIKFVYHDTLDLKTTSCVSSSTQNKVTLLAMTIFLYKIAADL